MREACILRILLRAEIRNGQRAVGMSASLLWPPSPPALDPLVAVKPKMWPPSPPTLYPLVLVQPNYGGGCSDADGYWRPSGIYDWSSALSSADLSSFCWSLVSSRALPEVPDGMRRQAVHRNWVSTRSSRSQAITIGMAVSLKEGEANYFGGRVLRRNCEIFARWVRDRRGLRINGSSYSIKCIYIGDAQGSPLLVTNSTSHLAHDSDFLTSSGRMARASPSSRPNRPWSTGS